MDRIPCRMSYRMVRYKNDLYLKKSFHSHYIARDPQFTCSCCSGKGWIKWGHQLPCTVCAFAVYPHFQ